MILAAGEKDKEEPCGDRARGDEAMVKAVGKEGI
jgi:hypothetical protein